MFHNSNAFFANVFLMLVLFPSAVGKFTSEPQPRGYVVAIESERPIFLSWPMPESIRMYRIPQYPNSPWTWNYLDLNPGYECPPAFGYLDDPATLPYWRDPFIPARLDRARADPHGFDMINCYSSQGPAGANGHEGTDIKASAGTPVYAAASGKVMQWQDYFLSSYIVLKHCLGGEWDARNNCSGGQQWYTTYMHVHLDEEFLQENTDVARGTQIATIYDWSMNSHLHFEVGLEKRGYTRFVNPWGRDQAPWDGCMWVDRSLCPYASKTPMRAALLDGKGTLRVQEGGLDEAWAYEVENVRQFQLLGDRLAILDAEGWLAVKEGSLDSPWVRQYQQPRAFMLGGRSLAMLDRDGNLLVKEGSLYADWVQVASSVQQFHLSSRRLGIIDPLGNLLVREGGLDQVWVPLASQASAFQLTDRRIAMLDKDGNLQVKTGDLRSEWEQAASGIVTFQLEDNRIAVLDQSGTLLVKEGSLYAPWVRVADSVQMFQLAGHRILVKDKAGRLLVKEGSLFADWAPLTPPSHLSLQLNGSLPVATDK